jgi:drug/metabolite transporter (DMT)-like permease
MAYAMALIPLLNASAKYLSRDYAIPEIVWARYAGHFFYMLIAFAPRRGIRLLITARPVMQLLRSTLLFASTALYFTAISYVPLPTAAAISFTGPFIVTILAPAVLGEVVGLRRWASVVLGFIGALVIVRPGMDANHWAAFLVFGSATTSALYQLFTRKLAAHDAAETSITYIALAGFVLASALLPFYWQRLPACSTRCSSSASAFSAASAITSSSAPTSWRRRRSSRPSTTVSCSAPRCSATPSSASSPTSGPGSAPSSSSPAAST